MHRILIVGEIGSGKSALSSILREMGYSVIDSDKSAADITRREDIFSRITDAGRELGFNINDKKSYMEAFLENNKFRESAASIIHPEVIRDIYSRERTIKSNEPRMISFIETGAEPYDDSFFDLFDAVINVRISARKIRQERLKKRGRGNDKRLISLQEKAHRNIISSLSRRCVKVVDIENSGTMNDLKEKASIVICGSLFSYLQSLNIGAQSRLRLALDAVFRRWSLVYPLPEKLFEEICERHTEPQRGYHNINHLIYMLKQMVCLPVESLSWQEAMSMILAICFHDIVYEPDLESERLSADLGENLIRKHLRGHEQLIDDVRKMIMATSRHFSDTPYDTSDTSQMVPIFLDLDLSILGDKACYYDIYSKGVRKEYSWLVGTSAYTAGRIDVLRNLIGRKRLFFTRYLGHLEKAAKDNMRKEIERLS